MAAEAAVSVLTPTLVSNNLRQHLGEGPIWHAGREELLYVDILNAKVSHSECIEFDSEMLAWAQTVSDGVQSKVLMCALENSSDL